MPFLAPRLIRANTSAILELIASQHTFIDRDRAEVSPEFRQIIPYVVSRYGDEYFVLTRTSKQREARLHHKRSLGIGGHVNPGHSLLEGLHKELDEEVAVHGAYDLEFVGIVNDDTTDVGRVHLGAVYILDAREKRIDVKETEKMSGEWMTRGAIRDVHESLESWSQIVYDDFIA